MINPIGVVNASSDKRSTRERTYQCPDCRKLFTRKDVMTRHRQRTCQDALRRIEESQGLNVNSTFEQDLEMTPLSPGGGTSPPPMQAVGSNSIPGSFRGKVREQQLPDSRRSCMTMLGSRGRCNSTTKRCQRIHPLPPPGRYHTCRHPLLHSTQLDHFPGLLISRQRPNRVSPPSDLRLDFRPWSQPIGAQHHSSSLASGYRSRKYPSLSSFD
ncbi:hypothetical protein M427DRAFT_59644, partial [Gonapodya prolifera JEL478]